MFYIVKAPRFFHWYYNECLWRVPTRERVIYLTFDDGPTPGITEFVLDTLNQFQAKATFFNVGQQVQKYPELHERLTNEGHAIGNHTYSHLNGWKTDSETYLNDVRKAKAVIKSDLFRPPYGRATKFQLYNLIHGKGLHLKPVMWHILSGDFDPKITSDQCYLNVIKNAVSGSIVVFHDSEKTSSILKNTLPRVLDYFSSKGFKFENLSNYFVSLEEGAKSI